MHSEKQISFEHWLAPDPAKLPDFIIAGAMKAGTSTIHQLLQRHPDISIPDEEVHFFDLDDTMEHPDFGNLEKGVSPAVEFQKHSSQFWDWYGKTLHSKAGKAAIIGEDSTTYLSSRLAIRRIAAQAKPMKLIVCLRQPTLRAYSNYWHLHKTRRVACSFEKLLQASPGSVLQRSCYGTQVRSLLSHTPREQVYFVVLEQLKTDYERIADELFRFVGADPARALSENERVHSNVGVYPKSLALQNTINRWFPAQQAVNYHAAMPFPEARPGVWSRCSDFCGRSFSKLNRSSQTFAPPMRPATKVHLDALFEQESAGLRDIIGVDVNLYWFDSAH